VLRVTLLIVSICFCGCSSRNIQPTFSNGAVAADSFDASQAGVDILKQGGNAVDAAVATSFALSIVRPESCGIGGGGFMMIDSPTMEPVALNYRETAPAIVGPAYYETHNSREGGTASGVPGTVAGLLAAHQRYGVLTREQVLAPAIRLSRGHRQEHVMQKIAEHGESGFYQGQVADAIVAATGSHITLEDLASYAPRWEKPLQITIGDGVTLVGMPPPSSGSVAIAQIIGLLQRIIPNASTTDELRYSQALVESMKHAFADRAEHMADPTFVDVPVEELLDATYLDSLASKINLHKTQDTYSYGSVIVPDDGGTSHFCVVDKDGMMVSATETINTQFGSKVFAEPFGFPLNNEMDDFSSPGGVNIYGLRQSEKNFPEPGKRPLSSMSPIIVENEGVPFLAIGGSGGPRIISAVVQVLLRMLWFDDEPIDAVQRARLHHQWLPNAVYFEETDMMPIVQEHLHHTGHSSRTRSHIGVVQVILVEEGKLKPWSDQRKLGEPAGY